MGPRCPDSSARGQQVDCSCGIFQRAGIVLRILRHKDGMVWCKKNRFGNETNLSLKINV